MAVGGQFICGLYNRSDVVNQNIQLTPGKHFMDTEDLTIILVEISLLQPTNSKIESQCIKREHSQVEIDANK